MRNALILLVVVALVILTAGAVNHTVAFDVDWVAGTWRAVSLFWIAAVVAVIVFAAGVAAALFARGGSSRAQRKLETELDTTYRRVRELEAAAPGAAGASAVRTGIAAAAAEQPAQTVVRRPEEAPATIVAPAGTAAAAPVDVITTHAGKTPQKESPSGSGTAVTVVASHGSARVTQVLPATSETEAGGVAGTDQGGSGDTAVTRVPDASSEADDAAGTGGSAEPELPAGSASAARPDLTSEPEATADDAGDDGARS